MAKKDRSFAVTVRSGSENLKTPYDGSGLGYGALASIEVLAIRSCRRLVIPDREISNGRNKNKG